MFVDPSTVLSWPPANRLDQKRHGLSEVVVECLLLALVSAILSVRVYTRRAISMSFGLDDILVLFAYLPAVGFTAVGLYGHFNLDWTVHVWDSNLESGSTSLKFSLVGQILFAFATTLTKLSTLALTYRLTVAGSSRTRHLVLAVGMIITLDATAFVIVTIFSCSPVSDFWTLSFTPQKCINETAHLLSASIINTLTDFIIVLLPIPVVARLSLPSRQRIIVYILFAGGIMASVAGAVRTYVTYLFISDPSNDLTWYAYYVILAGDIELYMGILCASIPATKPFFSRHLPRLVYSLSNSAGTQHRIQGNSNRSLAIFIINDTESETYLMPRPAAADMPSLPNLSKALPKSPSSLRATSGQSFTWHQDKTQLQPTSVRSHDGQDAARHMSRRVDDA